MAIRGRPPTPTLIKEKTGNPGNRPLNEAEPQPQTDPSTGTNEAIPPKTMTKRARVVWNRAVRMQAAGLYTICDEVLLASFCEAEATRLELQDEMSKQPLMIKGSTGQMVLNPLLKAINDQVRLIAQLGADLGFTPRSRQSLALEKDKPTQNKYAKSIGGAAPGLKLVK